MGTSGVLCDHDLDMKFTIQLPGEARGASINTMLPITHCLVGKRDDAFEKPDDELLRRTSLIIRGAKRPKTEEEVAAAEQDASDRVTAAQYRFRKSKGFYALQALAWGTLEECESNKSKFPAPEWDQNFQIVEAKPIQYA